ncbi:MAG: hypothetical protein JWO98_104, partial [Frankiales bacterium]|nr:hypothetical protein [Frankiales bacterium]
MSQLYRILITGSRDWDAKETVWQALADVIRPIPVDQDVVIVHGACPTGADEIA